MLKKIWRYLTQMVSIWFAPGFSENECRKGGRTSRRNRARQCGPFSKPRAYLSRRLAEARGNKDDLLELKLQRQYPGKYQVAEDLPGSYY